LKKLPYIILFLILGTPSVFWARHIVGGEITYKTVSRSQNSNKYEFTMRIYRDCDPEKKGAPYDPVASIAAYLKNAKNRPPIETSARLGSVLKVPKNKIDCLNPPNVCVEEGIYVWEMDLPFADDTYVILYQRCCRNESITNIKQPGTVGASYAVEITQVAQERGNDSPLFKSFPPIIICNSYPLKFDHSATDKDGDQLVYSFCEPYTGGGQVGGVGCSNTSPTPPCWPPFGTIAYKLPDYSFQRPVGGNPIIKIDPNTGLITGTPTESGQYVVSVCVEEYTQDGKLLGILKRDFQFNVAPCDPIIKAQVKADTVINKTYFISACGDRNLAIENRSFDQKSIETFRFDINIGGENKVFKEWQPTVLFPDTGIYKGKLFLNPGTICADTISLQFNVFNAVFPDFTYKYDTCVAGPIAFTDKTVAPNGNVVTWKWDYGDGKIDFKTNTSHLYDTPGKKRINLRVKDNKGCVKDTVREITWLPVPPFIVVQPSSFIGCTPANVFFNNLSKPIDSTYDIRWTFGDGGASRAISPTYVYNNPGTYSVSVDITSPIGCKIGTSFKDWIKIYQGTKAGFTFSPERVTKVDNTVSFSDKSQFATRWQWFFGSKGYASRQNPIFSFRDTGIQRVKLLVNNQWGCIDSMIQFIDVVPLVSYFLPNAFTPNDDTVNDIYRGNGITEGIQNFSMKIWNRWGEMIFETSNPTQGWNGKKFNKGEDSPLGVYLCVVTYTSPRGENFEIRSFANLIR
jgi:gliding motility-associated-like protein